MCTKYLSPKPLPEVMGIYKSGCTFSLEGEGQDEREFK